MKKNCFSFVAQIIPKGMIAHLKKVDKTTILEITIGFLAAIMVLRLLSLLFGRSNSMFSAEGSEDLENFGGRWAAKRRARRYGRKSTRQHNKEVMNRRAIEEGEEQGRAGRIDDEGENEMPDQEEYNNMLEMAEYFDSLDAEDIENMDAEEYAEYAEYLEMLEAA